MGTDSAAAGEVGGLAFVPLFQESNTSQCIDPFGIAAEFGRHRVLSGLAIGSGSTRRRPVEGNGAVGDRGVDRFPERARLGGPGPDQPRK